MAQLWARVDGQWAAFALAEQAVLLTGDEARPVVLPAGRGGWTPEQAGVSRSKDGRWALISGRRQVAVNGTPLELGLRVLRERDEVRIGECSVFFSGEQQARVVSFPGEQGSLRCARCQQPIDPEDLAVRCPACEMWHHQTDEYDCWTYEPTCAGCDQPTSLDAGLRWTPEDL